MKFKRKLAALFLSVLVIMSLSVPAYADDSGSLTLNTSACVKVGQSITLVAHIGSLEAFNVAWYSNNEAVAKVDSNGTVTGVSLGQASITAATSDGKTATCVVNVAFKGVDVSAHQGSIDWATLKNAGYDFAMIRTGYGSENWSSQTDSYFETNYYGAVQNGFKVGAYHYSYATSVAAAETEAEFCLHVLNGRSLDYPVVYDVEDKSQYGLSSDTLGAIVQAFCSKIQQAGYKTAVYSYPSFYNAHLTSSLVSQYDTWIASTGGVLSPKFSGSYTMWQYAVTSVPGVSGQCDVDYSFADYANGGTAQPVTPTPTVSDLDPLAFKSDTTGTYTFGTNKNYYYKITTADTIVPTCSSSNQSAVSVSYSKKVTDGFLFKLTNAGQGEAVITTTAGDGRNTSFTAVGTSGGAVTPTVPSPAEGSALTCDTTSPYTFGSNATYCYKITSSDTAAPKAVSSNSSAVSVAFYKSVPGGYLYKITNTGKGTATITTTATGGTKASFTAYGTAAAGGTVISDTPSRMAIKKGHTYQFKFTVSGKVSSVNFASGNGSVVKTVSVQKITNGYLYKLMATGSGSVGVYSTVSGKAPVRQCVVTVS